MKDLGGGVLYLDLEGGLNDHYCKDQLRPVGGKTKLNINGYNFIRPLLLNQPYIEDVKVYNGEEVDHNLNKFRQLFTKGGFRSQHGCLLDVQRQALGLPVYDVNVPWLDCGDPIKLNKKILISRSPRYQSAYSKIQGLRLFFQDKAIFIGIKKEHELFEWTFDIKIDFFESNNALEIAKVIKGSECIMSNSTLNLALAIGLGHPNIVQELDKICMLTLFPTKKGMRLI